MLTILIPAAGGGRRFAEAGYKEPKPMVDVLGEPMLWRVMNNLRPKADHGFIIVSQLPDNTLPMRWMDLAIRTEPTQGALDTILRARDHVYDEPLLLANCDQLVAFDADDFVASLHGVDGVLATFRSNLAHHSYVTTDEDGTITSIVEKEVVGNQAVTGLYAFANGRVFLDYAAAVVESGYRVKGEFYVSTAIGMMVADGYRFTTYDAPAAMLGTPDELHLFEAAVAVGKTL